MTSTGPATTAETWLKVIRSDDDKPIARLFPNKDVTDKVLAIFSGTSAGQGAGRVFATLLEWMEDPQRKSDAHQERLQKMSVVAKYIGPELAQAFGLQAKDLRR